MSQIIIGTWKAHGHYQAARGRWRPITSATQQPLRKTKPTNTVDHLSKRRYRTLTLTLIYRHDCFNYNILAINEFTNLTQFKMQFKKQFISKNIFTNFTFIPRNIDVVNFLIVEV